MVADDDLQAELLPCGDLRRRRDPAVDREDETAALVGEPRERLPAKAVAFVEAARQVPLDLGAELAQDQDGESRRADPVGVVVAMDADPPAGGDRAANGLAGRDHVAEAERVVRGQRAFEERTRPRDVVIPAPDEHRRRSCAHLQLARQRHDGVVLARLDRPAALVHGQSTLGVAPDGTRAGFSSCCGFPGHGKQKSRFRHRPGADA